MSVLDKDFVVYNKGLAKYISQKGIVWKDVRVDLYDKNKVIFVYDSSINNLLQQIIKEYKEQNKQERGSGNRNNESGLHTN